MALTAYLNRHSGNTTSSNARKAQKAVADLKDQAYDPQPHIQEAMRDVERRFTDSRRESVFNSGSGYAVRFIVHIGDGQYKKFEEDYEFHAGHNGPSIPLNERISNKTKATHLMAQQLRQCLVKGYNGRAGVKVEVICGRIAITPLGSETSKSQIR